MTEKPCELCLGLITGEAIIQVAGLPEREHRFCSELCRDRFLRMEDDQLEYNRIYPEKGNKLSKLGGGCNGSSK